MIGRATSLIRTPESAEQTRGMRRDSGLHVACISPHALRCTRMALRGREREVHYAIRIPPVSIKGCREGLFQGGAGVLAATAHARKRRLAVF